MDPRLLGEDAKLTRARLDGVGAECSDAHDTRDLEQELRRECATDARVKGLADERAACKCSEVRCCGSRARDCLLAKQINAPQAHAGRRAHANASARPTLITASRWWSQRHASEVVNVLRDESRRVTCCRTGIEPDRGQKRSRVVVRYDPNRRVDPPTLASCRIRFPCAGP